MAARHAVVTYFLEDTHQEAFIVALVTRLCVELGMSVRHDVRMATGGSKSFAELRTFLRDVQRQGSIPTDLLIVGKDGNCTGPMPKRAEIQHEIHLAGFTRPVVCAVPDPHVEHWYLCDPEAVRHALSEAIHPVVPQYKCARDVYKRLLDEAIQQAGIEPIIGGAEHAEAIVDAMDLYRAGQNAPSLHQFIDDLRAALLQARHLQQP